MSIPRHLGVAACAVVGLVLGLAASQSPLRAQAVRIARIPQGQAATTKPPLATGLPDGPQEVGESLVRVDGGAVAVTIQSYANGDAYLVELTPAARVAVPRAVR